MREILLSAYVLYFAFVCAYAYNINSDNKQNICYLERKKFHTVDCNNLPKAKHDRIANTLPELSKEMIAWQEKQNKRPVFEQAFSSIRQNQPKGVIYIH